MTYRNDHDAALARIESLERDNAQLRDEVAALRGPTSASHDDDEPRARGIPRSVAALVLGTIIAIIALVATTIRDSDPAEHRADDVRVTMPDAPSGGWR